MSKQKLFKTLMLAGFFILTSGCAKRVVIDYNHAKLNSLVEIRTVTGKSSKGIIRSKNASFMVMQLDKYKKNLTKIKRTDISRITGLKTYVYDTQKKIISEWEIDRNKKNSNIILYTLGGSGLSFGASFFAGSLLSRGIDDVDRGKNFMWATAATGTILGTALFAKAGYKRDRNVAIEKIREQRIELAKKKAEIERQKRKKIQDELRKIKAERKKQDEEILKLKSKTPIK